MSPVRPPGGWGACVRLGMVFGALATLASAVQALSLARRGPMAAMPETMIVNLGTALAIACMMFAGGTFSLIGIVLRLDDKRPFRPALAALALNAAPIVVLWAGAGMANLGAT